ncbi:abortive phage resistance protein [Acinetobacter sp. ANC 4218]|uniref:abortive infection family protein n=2 Tax=unclassified Acinetobacter TaxID=196816 RepID=UPI000A33C556|nr:abortive infection family protein [Acinetobacter sp. ANC 4218]OTG72169.1 abortive phage resistance protein [Acinetobacter sp. ANC 4218]
MKELIEKVTLLQQILIARATHRHEESDASEFLRLRNEVISEQNLKKYIPSILKTSRTLDQYWEKIKQKFEHYAERRNYIYIEFHPLLEYLENSDSVPSDQIIANVIKNLDSSYIHTTWSKALERRTVDPEGAITIARTLLESTCKHILDEATVTYGDAPDLNHLYRLTAKQLNLSPSQHTQPVFKQILGGCTSVVEGLGALRNKISDAHGQGKLNVKPSSRHAELAVNLAGTMAVFLFSTWELRNESIVES